MNKKTGRVSATVLGLISGIIHGIVGTLFAFLLFLGGGLTRGLFGRNLDNILNEFTYLFDDFALVLSIALIVIGIVVLIITLLNLIGGCIVRRSRIAGGVLMLITSIPIISISTFGSWLYYPAFTGFFLLTGLMSFTAAILAFIPYSRRYKQLYAQRTQQKLNQQQQQQQQRYQPQQQPYQPQQQQPYQPPAAPPVAPEPTAPPVAPEPVAPPAAPAESPDINKGD